MDKSVGVLGGGQLGRMFTIAARQLGYRIHSYSPDEDTPAGQVADVEVTASYEDLDALRAFAGGVDVVTFEFENVPAETLGAKRPVPPQGASMGPVAITRIGREGGAQARPVAGLHGERGHQAPRGHRDRSDPGLVGSLKRHVPRLWQLGAGVLFDPFYTGTQKSVDNMGGRVEKFRNRFGKTTGAVAK